MEKDTAITYASARWDGRKVIVEIRKGEEREVFSAQGGKMPEGRREDDRE